MKKVVIGSDHAGFKLKEKIKDELGSKYSFLDMGTDDENSVDYPIYAQRVAEMVAGDRELLGVLVCGSGIGVSIAANKVPGVRAALVYTQKSAQFAREHNNANVLATASRDEGVKDPIGIVKTFLETSFSGDERHTRRIDQISQIEKKYSK